jgi:hypothetical protein
MKQQFIFAAATSLIFWPHAKNGMTRSAKEDGSASQGNRRAALVDTDGSDTRSRNHFVVAQRV